MENKEKMAYLEVGKRPWGEYYVMQDEEHFKLKKIVVNPGQRLSYQFHFKRQEFWTVVKGNAVVTLEGEEYILGYGQSIFISQEAKHRIENKGSEPLEFIEVQTGTYFGEDDIVRIEDDYRRD